MEGVSGPAWSWLGWLPYHLEKGQSTFSSGKLLIQTKYFLQAFDFNRLREFSVRRAAVTVAVLGG